jgi:hypothetical protein
VRADVAAAAQALERWGSERGWAGCDPYDGLNATRFVAPLTRRPFGRRLVTQAVKISPLNLRPLVGVPHARSSAAVANVVSAYARDGIPGIADSETKLRSALDALEALRLPSFEEPCWGYHFDVQTRVFFYPKGSPNTIATAFAGMALLDAHAATGDERALELAEGTGDFFVRHVPQTDAAPGAYFGYLVGDRTPIHNANLLVCALLARLHVATGRADLAAAAAAGVEYTVSRQRADGSWPYGEEPHLGWVDNFHTGYVLEALMTCSRCGIAGGDEALRRGLEHYRRDLFRADGAPKYMPDSTYPIDIQCVAQAIQTFALAAQHEPIHGAAAAKVFGYAQRRMRRRDGAYAFQRRRLWTNRTPHVRWAAAPMFLALVHLHRALGEPV